MPILGRQDEKRTTERLRVEWRPLSGDHFWVELRKNGWGIGFEATLDADPNLGADGRVLAFYWLTATQVPLNSELREVNILRHAVAYLSVFGGIDAQDISRLAKATGMSVDAHRVVELIVAHHEYPDPMEWLADVRNKMNAQA